MIFNRKQKYRVTLAMTIRSLETYDEVDNPEGVLSGQKYFRRTYFRRIDLPYPPIMGMIIAATGNLRNSPVIRIQYNEYEKETVCFLEDFIPRHEWLIKNIPQIKNAFLIGGWFSRMSGEVGDPILDSED